MDQYSISRRTFGGWLTGAACASPLAGFAQSNYPDKPIRLLVGLAAGGSLDAMARSISHRLSETGVQMVVDNKPGASMMLSAAEAMRAQPDGYTLLFAPSSVFAQNPHTLSNVPYDPFKDFTPVSMVARGPLVLVVNGALPVHDVKELVAWAKAHPGQLNFASFGTGTSSHIYAMNFAKTVGIEITHVPYKGTGDVASDLLAGRVQAYFDAAPTAIQNAKTGRTRMIGVAAPKRMAAAPEVPTFTEQGVPGMDLTSWVAIFGPAKMSKETLAKVNAVIVGAVESAEVKEFVARGAYEAAGSTPQELEQEVRVAYDKWGAMVKKIGFQKQ